MTPNDMVEKAARDAAMERLESEGYKVISEPSRDIIPAFLGQHIPDLIAFSPSGPNKIVEIKRKEGNYQRRLREIRERFEGVDGWELMVVLVDPFEQPEISLPDLASIQRKTKVFARLIEQGFYESALVLAWAILEGLVRLKFYDKARRPLKPASTLQILESEGLVSSDMSNRLRRLIVARNEFVHGVFNFDVDFEDLSLFKAIILNLVKQLAIEQIAIQKGI